MSGSKWRSLNLGAESVRVTRGKGCGPKLMNQCKPEKVDAKEHGKMLERILVLEERKGSCEK